MGDKKNTVLKKVALMVFALVGIAWRAIEHKAENNEVSPSAEEVVEPTFQGIKESDLTQLAQTISRGERVKVLGEKVLIFFYKSKRGREQQSTKFVVDEAGNLIRYEGMGPYALANTPKFFQEKLFEVLNNNH